MCKLKLSQDFLFKSNAVLVTWIFLPHRQTNTPKGIKCNALVLGGPQELFSGDKRSPVFICRPALPEYLVDDSGGGDVGDATRGGSHLVLYEIVVLINEMIIF